MRLNPHIVDDRTPTTRKFKRKDYEPSWGENKLNRDWPAFTAAEERAANAIGLPQADKPKPKKTKHATRHRK